MSVRVRSDLTGKQFGKWTVTGRAPDAGEPLNRRVRWHVICECGERSIRDGKSLKLGISVRCRKCASPPKYPPGSIESKEYTTWACMRSRCSSPGNQDYHHYGGRGISVCSRWNESFLAFLEDMGPAPTVKHSIDRIDNNGNYEPGNCRWATQHQQTMNKRSTILITHNGKTQCLAEWARETGIPFCTLRARYLVGNRGKHLFRALQIQRRVA